MNIFYDLPKCPVKSGILLELLEGGNPFLAFERAGAVLTREDVVPKKSVAVVTPECLPKLCHVDDPAMLPRPSVQVDGEVYRVAVVQNNKKYIRVRRPHDSGLEF